MEKFKSFNEFAGFNQIDMIGYGNETLEYRMQYNTDTEPEIIRIVREHGLLEELHNKPFPKNSSQETINEINEMVKYQHGLTNKDIKFIKDVEHDISLVINEYLIKIGVGDHLDLMKKISSFTDPLLYKLKNHYNRPRPYQLARALDIDMFPVVLTNAGTAAYPSGHALDAYMIAEIISQIHPDKKEIKDFCNIAAHTRVISGIHYQSDQEFSREICNIIINIVPLEYFYEG
jgi:hypothetical protein